MESLETPLRIFVPSPDLPTIQENPETPTFGIPMMLVGIGIAGIVVVATGIFLWRMFTTEEKIPNNEIIPIDEPMNQPDDEEGDDPTALNLRSRKVNRE